MICIVSSNRAFRAWPTERSTIFSRPAIPRTLRSLVCSAAHLNRMRGPASFVPCCRRISLQSVESRTYAISVLTVHINNAAWATRLRFLIPALLPNLNRLADFTTVNEIRLRWCPWFPPPTATRNTASVRPPDPVPLLELASRVDYAGLRSAILRLAAYAETRRPSQNDTSAPAAEPAADAESGRRPKPQGVSRLRGTPTSDQSAWRRKNAGMSR